VVTRRADLKVGYVVTRRADLKVGTTWLLVGPISKVGTTWLFVGQISFVVPTFRSAHVGDVNLPF